MSMIDICAMQDSKVGIMRIPFHLSFLLNVTKANHFQDIVIVDTQKDLNVFKDMFQGQKEDGPPLGCCTPEPS